MVSLPLFSCRGNRARPGQRRAGRARARVARTISFPFPAPERSWNELEKLAKTRNCYVIKRSDSSFPFPAPERSGTGSCNYLKRLQSNFDARPKNRALFRYLGERIQDELPSPFVASSSLSLPRNASGARGVGFRQHARGGSSHTNLFHADRTS